MMKLVIFQLTNLWWIHLDGCFLYLVMRRLLSVFGHENAIENLHGGTLYQDATMGIIWVAYQVLCYDLKNVSRIWLLQKSLTCIVTMVCLLKTFPWLIANQRISLKLFPELGQMINMLAERAIQAIIYMARWFMVHVSLLWSERRVGDLSLWGFASNHAAWIHNCTPSRTSGLTKIMLTRIKADHKDLLHSHSVFFQCLSLIQSCRMARNPWVKLGINSLNFSCSWVSQMSIHP